MLPRRDPSGVATAARSVAALLLVAIVATGCGTSPPRGDGAPPDAASFPLPPNPVPRAEPLSRYGNPRTYVVDGVTYHTLRSSRGYVARGVASWYGTKFHGRRTSSGELYDMYAMTAAHRTLPLPTYVSVHDLENGRTIVVRVNDRGPFHSNRLIDLSYAAARKLGILAKGTGLVEIRALQPGQPPPPPTPPVRLARNSGGGIRLYLQIGAFALRANAERLIERLVPVVGAVVRISEAELQGRHLYRVRLGPLADVEQADRLSRRVEGLGLGLPSIVLD